MIKLENINKYYFKGDNREIHVVNNVSLEFPDAGFVTILGASGSGKTTLLNIIAGLDKYDSGSVTYDDKVFNKYKMDDVDALRNEKMGYIFQNYLLINHFSVYENLRIALEAIDVTDPKEQKKRIEYALRCVGLFKYRKKKVKNLSGGQMQRVSIARCIVKNCDIIIADEPTGNVDTENTVQIMNILKKISQTKLVILVTHEMNIARYYSDRIIQIKDGKIISDGIVTNNGTLNTQTDRKIYLGDLDNEKSAANKLNFELYVDESSTESNLIIAVRNDTLYIKSDKKIVNLNESSIELVNDSYHDVEDSLQEFEFDTSWYEKPTTKSKKEFFFTNFINGFREFKNQSNVKILFIIINLILGALVGTCFINLNNLMYVNTDDITKDNVGSVVVTDQTIYDNYVPSNNYNLYLEAFEEGIIDEIIPYSHIESYVRFEENFVFGESHTIKHWIYSYNSDMKLICGSRPYNEEIVIGKELADKLITIYGYKNRDYQKLLGMMFNNRIISGVAEKETDSLYVNPITIYNYLSSNGRGRTITIDNIGYFNGTFTLQSGRVPTNSKEVIIDRVFALENELKVNSSIKLGEDTYTIVGIFSEENIVDVPSILTVDINIFGKTLDILDWTLTDNKFTYEPIYLPSYEYEIVEGRKPLNNNECLVNVSSPLQVGSSIHGYRIVGKYAKNYNDGTLGNTFMYDNVLIISGYNYIQSHYEITFEFSEEADEYFNHLEYEIYDHASYQKIAGKKQNISSNVSMIVLSIVLFSVFILLTYLTNRGRIINEIHTIGVYRSIGKSRKTLIYQKIGYNFLMISISSVIGYSISWIINHFVNGFKDLFAPVAKVNFLIVLLGILALYVIGIFIGIIPTLSLIKKTPSEINSKYDI